MPTYSKQNEREHGIQDWSKVRLRAMLEETTVDDWENASPNQKHTIHQIKLGLTSAKLTGRLIINKE